MPPLMHQMRYDLRDSNKTIGSRCVTYMGSLVPEITITDTIHPKKTTVCGNRNLELRAACAGTRGNILLIRKVNCAEGVRHPVSGIWPGEASGHINQCPS